jgi:hypothetical protein
VELSTRNGIEHLWPHRPAVGVEVGPTLREELRLVLHILAAARGHKERDGSSEETSTAS